MAYDNSPWCGEEAIKDASECGVAAKSLGHSEDVYELSDTTWASGCLMDSVNTIFNDITGTTSGTGNSAYQSVCLKAGKVYYFY